MKTKVLLKFSVDSDDLDNVEGQLMGSETSRKANDQGKLSFSIKKTMANCNIGIFR
jgi:hypothetical protein